MVYPDVSRDWVNVDRPPNRDARDAVDELVARLLKVCANPADAVKAEVDQYLPIPFLRFDGSAQELFDEWRHDLENKIRSDDDHPAIVSHLSKYRKLVPSLALINHLSEGGSGPVTERALSQAVLLARYLESHARRVYSYASRPDVDAARSILAKLRTGKLKTTFKTRDVYRAGWSGLSSPDEAWPAIHLLRDYGYLFEVEEKDTGGRPSQTFKAHPSIRTGL
jgi:putative DNA primase/helicase